MAQPEKKVTFSLSPFKKNICYNKYKHFKNHFSKLPFKINLQLIFDIKKTYGTFKLYTTLKTDF
jgi:hypothetical protein